MQPAATRARPKPQRLAVSNEASWASPSIHASRDRNLPSTTAKLVPEIVLIVQLFVLLFAITVHEASHGLAAYRMGDPTAHNLGRVTLNPLVHFDLFGTIALLFAGFGWAGVALLKQWLRHLVSEGRTVFMTTHVLETVERLCDRVAIIKSPGKLIWEGDISAFASDQPISVDGQEFRTLEDLFLGLSGERYAGTLAWL
jgi:hypothetical protein